MNHKTHYKRLSSFITIIQYLYFYNCLKQADISVHLSHMCYFFIFVSRNEFYDLQTTSFLIIIYIPVTIINLVYMRLLPTCAITFYNLLYNFNSVINMVYISELSVVHLQNCKDSFKMMTIAS